MSYDLHCHSTASDGSLSPKALIERAQQQGVTTLALTDHDTTQGLAEAQQAALAIGIRLIPGIELSTSWHGHCIHIVGLQIEVNNPALQQGIAYLQTAREARAQKIASKLAHKRIPDAYEAVKQAAGQGMITRKHFADFLVQQQQVTTQQEAFDRYLGQGKSAYVNTVWANFTDAITWIIQAGGIPVLAHPMRYKLSGQGLRRLLTEFKAAGGQAVELLTPRNTPEEIKLLCQYLNHYALYASVGSDFHCPDAPWQELGRFKTLPEDINPVWQLFTAL